MDILKIIDEIIQLIPQNEENQAEKYGSALASLLALQNKAGKIDKELSMLMAEVQDLESRKETLAQGYSDQLAYRNESLSYTRQLPKEYAQQTQMEQEVVNLRNIAKQTKSLF